MTVGRWNSSRFQMDSRRLLRYAVTKEPGKLRKRKTVLQAILQFIHRASLELPNRKVSWQLKQAW